MSIPIDFFNLLLLRLRMAFDGVLAFGQIGAAIVRAEDDRWKAKAAAAFQPPHVQHLALRPLRAFAPNLAPSQRIATVYPNSGTVIVARYRDAIEVLDRNADFEVLNFENGLGWISLSA